MPEKYDRGIIQRHFDTAGLNEWERMVKTPRDLVSLHIHKHYLQKYIRKGDKVLEIGSGPGRFTIEMARLGASISIVDVSTAQLKLNEEKVTEAGYENAVQWRKQMDIVDLSEIPDYAYDACVVYGGPISYVMENASLALDEVFRVTKEGGRILLSIMSAIGTWYLFVEGVFDSIHELGLDRMQQLFEDGNVTGKLSSDGHHCHMYRWSEFQALLEKHPREMLVASSCGVLSNSLHSEEKLRKEMQNPESWKVFLQWELEFSKEPGALDCGTHIIVVLKKI
ncbi:MAG: class I SAM-dependent methyltransferase [Candidatus Thorarchaeota archaeon]